MFARALKEMTKQRNIWVKVWLRNMAKLKEREKGTQSKMKVPLTSKEAEEGKRRVKFAGRVKSGDQEDDFKEHSLSHICPNLI